MNRVELEAAYGSELNARGVDPFLQGILTDADRLRLRYDGQNEGPLKRNIRQLRQIRQTETERGTRNSLPGIKASGAVLRYKEGAHVTGRV